MRQTRTQNNVNQLLNVVKHGRRRCYFRKKEERRRGIIKIKKLFTVSVFKFLCVCVCVVVVDDGRDIKRLLM